MCALVEADDPAKRRATCSYPGAGPCEQVSIWDTMCDGDYVVSCQRCPHRNGWYIHHESLVSVVPDAWETDAYRYCWETDAPGRLARIEHCANGCVNGRCIITP